ncbi:MAG: dihydrolipoamide acetyltransferase family protein [Sulfobacillus sp.]
MLVKMPQLGESVVEGTINRWLKAPGDQVSKYEPLVEVTTDKVNAEVPSPVDGTLKTIIAQDGQTLAVGEVICEIDSQEQPVESAPAAEAPPPAAPAPAPVQPAVAAGGIQPRTSPLVRRLAKEAGVDLTQVRASGPDGRITRDDLEAHLKASVPGATAPAVAPISTAAPVPAAAAERAAAAPPKPVAVSGEDTAIDLTPMRRAIAEHMVRTKATSPHATAWFEVDVSGVASLRQKIRTDFERREGVPLTFLPFVIQAAVVGLKSFPILNSSFDGEHQRIILRRAIHIGVAVAIPDGLIVPVIHHADRLSLSGLAKTLQDLIERARSGRLTLDDIQGGTFTVNNPGSYGSMLSTPLINQPQAAILSMEKIVKRPVVVGDAIAIRSMMNLSMSFDHRVLDGAVANRYLAQVKEALEGLGPDSPIS